MKSTNYQLKRAGRRMLQIKKAAVGLTAATLFQTGGCDLGQMVGNLIGNVFVGVMDVVESAGAGATSADEE